jgi:hypothetical protein
MRQSVCFRILFFKVVANYKLMHTKAMNITMLQNMFFVYGRMTYDLRLKLLTKLNVEN